MCNTDSATSDTMPSSSTHDTLKERNLLAAYIRAHVRLWHADETHFLAHLSAAFAAVLEVEEAQLEECMMDDEGYAVVEAEEKRIEAMKEGREKLVKGAAEEVEDVARDVGVWFGVMEQRVLYQVVDVIRGGGQRCGIGATGLSQADAIMVDD